MTLPTATDLAGYTLAQQHPITTRWTPAEHRVTLLAEEHQLDVDLATDQRLAVARRDRFAPEQPAELLFNIWEQVRPGLYVMLSMRYEDGNPARPFVDVSATTRPLIAESDIAATAQLAVQRYGVLRPLYLRWWTCQQPFSIPGVGHDKRFLAAPIHDLADRSVPGSLTIRPSQDLSNYDRAVAAYQSVDQAHPAHPRQAMIETADELADLQAEGTLFDVLLDGDWAGYIAVETGHKLGLAGYKVAELILTETARGHGFGRYLTTLVSQTLLTRDPLTSAVLIGTIHPQNTGALRAAQRSGRHDVGGWITRPLTT